MCDAGTTQRFGGDVKEPIVTADELLDLADTVSRYAFLASKALQYGIKERLEAVLPNIVNAAQLAALREVQDRRSTPEPSKAEGGTE